MINFVFIDKKEQVVQDVAQKSEPTPQDYDKKGFLRYILAGECAELLQIYINESQRKKGYGSKLLAFLERECSRKGIDAIFVHSTSTEQQVFGQFLIAKGFIRTCFCKDEEESHKYQWIKKI